jgi:hypothetical protein
MDGCWSKQLFDTVQISAVSIAGTAAPALKYMLYVDRTPRTVHQDSFGENTTGQVSLIN